MVPFAGAVGMLPSKPAQGQPNRENAQRPWHRIPSRSPWRKSSTKMGGGRHVFPESRPETSLKNTHLWLEQGPHQNPSVRPAQHERRLQLHGPGEVSLATQKSGTWNVFNEDPGPRSCVFPWWDAFNENHEKPSPSWQSLGFQDGSCLSRQLACLHSESPFLQGALAAQQG